MILKRVDFIVACRFFTGNDLPHGSLLKCALPQHHSWDVTVCCAAISSTPKVKGGSWSLWKQTKLNTSQEGNNWQVSGSSWNKNHKVIQAVTTIGGKRLSESALKSSTSSRDSTSTSHHPCWSGLSGSIDPPLGNRSLTVHKYAYWITKFEFIGLTW